MDELAGLLDGSRARGAFVLRSVLDPPWSLRVQDESPLVVIAMVQGNAWVIPDDGGEPTFLPSGSVAVVRGPEYYTVADELKTPPQVVINPGQHCTTMDGEDVGQTMDLGVRTWGNCAEGSTVMMCGVYEMDSEVSKRLLHALPKLPDIVHVADSELDGTLVALFASEVTKDEPGQEVVLDRLLDLLLVAVLRAWFSRPEAEAPAWYRAQSDPVVGRALRLLQNNPAHPWTVAKLASEIGISRAALARRFTEQVGEPPMSFLANWRLTIAADLLREPDTTVAVVASKVGYSSPFALSTAFKRIRGISPREHRLALAQ